MASLTIAGAAAVGLGAVLGRPSPAPPPPPPPSVEVAERPEEAAERPEEAAEAFAAALATDELAPFLAALPEVEQRILAEPLRALDASTATRTRDEPGHLGTGLDLRGADWDAAAGDAERAVVVARGRSALTVGELPFGDLLATAVRSLPGLDPLARSSAPDLPASDSSGSSGRELAVVAVRDLGGSWAVSLLETVARAAAGGRPGLPAVVAPAGAADPRTAVESQLRAVLAGDHATVAAHLAAPERAAVAWLGGPPPSHAHSAPASGDGDGARIDVEASVAEGEGRARIALDALRIEGGGTALRASRACLTGEAGRDDEECAAALAAGVETIPAAALAHTVVVDAGAWYVSHVATVLDQVVELPR